MAAREAIAASGVRPDVIGITNQRETIVLWHRDTGKPLARAIVVAGPADDRALRGAQEQDEHDRRADWAAPRSLLLGDEDRMAAQEARDPVRRAKRQTARGHDRQLAHLEAHGRQSSRDGSDQRVPHPSLRHQSTEMEQGAVRSVQDSDRDPAGGPAVVRRLRQNCDFVLRKIAADHGSRRRSTGRALRSGMLRRGAGEEHVRHRRVSAPQHRQDRAEGGRGFAGDCRVRREGRSSVRTGSFDLRRRRRDPVASRRARNSVQRIRERATRALSRFQRRRLLRARPSSGSARRTGSRGRGGPSSD